MPTLTADSPVYFLDLGSDENRFHPDWIAEVNRHLDTVVESDEPAALVTHGTGKFYSNGLDLDWLSDHADDYADYVHSIHALLARMLTLPVPTIAAVNGHAFGGGAMLAIAHDFRIMREDRGYFCFPEVDIHIPFTSGMAALIQAKLSPSDAVASMTTGRRFPGPDAVAAGLVGATAADTELLGSAATHIRSLAGKHRETLAQIKSTMFATAVEHLRADPWG